MYHKKRLICYDKSGKIVATLTLSGEGGKVGIKISPPNICDEIFIICDNFERSFKSSESIIIPYWGGNISSVLLEKGRVIGVTKGVSYSTILQKLTDNDKEKTTKKPKEVKTSPKVAEPIPKKVEPPQEKPLAPTIEVEKEVLSRPKEDNSNLDGQKEVVKEEIKHKVEEKEVANFYCSIKKSLDETFTCYPNVKLLEDMIPYSTWVEIKKEAPYVVGLIREGDKPKYVCYGVESDNSHTPPKDVERYCQWLPTEEYKGYWIIFQDADTGETLLREE